MLAIENNHIELVKWMVNFIEKKEEKKEGKNDHLEVVNTYGKNALIIASEFGKYEIVEWLLYEKNINPNTHRKKDKVSALMYACSGGTKEHEKVVEIFLTKGINLFKY
jgi:ankyrin repeat protein